MSRLTRIAARLGEPRYRALWVLVISGALGFRIAFVAYPTWQVAVETAQVVAGLVHYPTGNPFYIYHTKLWTVLHQICALALLAGVSEITLSKVLSGIVGMVSFQALSMSVFALSRNVLLAIGASLFVLATRSASNGATYPILLMSTEHTYGSLGLSAFVLAAASLGAGSYALGGFLVGLMPSIHPSLGLWLWILVAAGLAWDFRDTTAEFRPGLKWFLAGAAVTTVSLAVQLIFTYDVPRLNGGEAARYLTAFVSFWDGHRAPVELASLGMVLNRGALALALIWLASGAGLTRSAAFFLRVVAVSALLGLAMAYLSWIPVDKMPVTFLMLMPARLLNFDGMIFVPLLLGLLGLYQNRLSGRLLLLALLMALALSPRSQLWEWSVAAPWAWWQNGFDPDIVIETIAIGLLALGAADWARQQRSIEQPAGAAVVDDESVARDGEEPVARVAKAALWGPWGLSVALMGLTGFLTLRLHPDTTSYFRDRTNDRLFSTIAAEQEGLVLTAGSYQMVQMATRRPVLLNGALDQLPYAPESGPGMERILLDVYGVDLFHPPEGARKKGVLPRDLHRDLWEHNSLDRWREIRRAYDVRLILVPAEWNLALPVAVEDHGFRVYRIPA